MRRRPRVALIASGDELIDPGTPPRPGQIIEFNTHMLAALVQGWGGEALRLPRVVDQRVDIELLVPRAEPERPLVHVGSHDMALELLGDVLRRRHPGRSLASANVGSLGGLYALERGECHFTGTHLIDPQTGEYNISYVRRVCRDRKVALVSMCEREQGLSVARGNPLGIRGFADLARPDVRFVNRQRGAGTRVLLDMRLAELGIAPTAIRGYEREEYTHMASAVAIVSGVADCALTIRAAAVALGLDFVPLERERYELALPIADLDSPATVALLDALRSPEFRAAAEALGGYSASGAGTDIREVR